MTPINIVLASNNQHKLIELTAALPDSFALHPASEFNVDSPDETGTTFIENAIIKARHSSAISGLPAIADDSGLEVDFLDHAPGIFSSRFAGPNASDEENNAKLLDELKNAPADQRTARFQCVLVYLRHKLDPMPIIATGTWHGSIVQTPTGEKGFGYDPVFFIPTHGVTAASLDANIKNSISHRGRAVAELIPQLSSAQAIGRVQ
ncbi:MAG: RdgB/HAM1 family non-canonical purine NTP pyrophosphatase [Pseudomonadales bacterium]|nr:RdgB/HAM1 family non-canonical purine NTP pyrophosphatase [Pseudomonadales bacterium]MDG1442522.1 RdgB/HAM1 family non-canonical purine NTP pyrophosphatase [Pseudomonadales bacterium]